MDWTPVGMVGFLKSGWTPLLFEAFALWRPWYSSLHLAGCWEGPSGLLAVRRPSRRGGDT